MKKIFTLLFAAFTVASMSAQQHTPMSFVGASNAKVSTMDVNNESDTIQFKMNDLTSGDITLPEMKGMSAIPSFTIKGATFTMGANHVVEFPSQEFSATVSVDGNEKTIKGSSLSATYNMADNSFDLSATFTYGSMPFPVTYTVKGYYVKPVTDAISVCVGSAFTYTNSSVTYNVRKYKDGDVEKVDVAVPAYTLDNTLIGNLSLGAYTVKGLVYDSEQGGFYRDYKDDGLTFHFSAEQNGKTTINGDYAFNKEKDNNILVKYDGTKITSIINKFQMGAMPFAIVSTFNVNTTAINTVKTDNKPMDGKAYNIAGQRVSDNYKGIVIINGKKYLRK